MRGRYRSHIAAYLLFTVVLLVPLIPVSAQSAVACQLAHGDAVDLSVFGQGWLSCEFSGNAGDAVYLWCGGCQRITVLDPAGNEVFSNDDFDPTSGEYILPESGTYAVGFYHAFTESVATGSECGAFEDRYDSNGLYMGTDCVLYDIIYSERDTYGTVSINFEFLDPNAVSNTTDQDADSTVESDQDERSAVNLNPVIVDLSDLCSTRDASVRITLKIDELQIVDAEEADTNSIIGGDEAFLIYGIGILVDDQWEIGQNSEYLVQWDANAVEGDVFDSFQSITREVECSETAGLLIAAVEDDGWLGSTTLGMEQVEITLDSGETLELVPETEVIFSGVANDGPYDYRVKYTTAIDAS
ncbi:MAG: hypothetical protein JNJ61_21765 [Anaerolineae bacterium]|nr:hypothetical protein [Anaerolineae bacterium]